MHRRSIRRGAAKKIGLSPGTLVQLDKHESHETVITIFDYDKDNFTEKN